MQSIFEPLRTDWDSLTGCVHVYALPRWDPSAVRPWQDAIARTGVCEMQPPQFLHATVARTPLFLPSPDHRPSALRSLTDALDRIAHARTVFELPLRRPEVMTTAVCATGEATPDWDCLVSDVRAAIAVAVPDRPTPAGPHAPHVSLGYARRTTDDAPLTAALGALADEPWTSTLRVDALPPDDLPDLVLENAHRIHVSLLCPIRRHPQRRTPLDQEDTPFRRRVWSRTP